MTKTPREYDELAGRYGVQYALREYPYSLTYRYSIGDSGAPVWTLFFHRSDERQKFADGVRAVGGEVLSADHGDTNLYRTQP